MQHYVDGADLQKRLQNGESFWKGYLFYTTLLGGLGLGSVNYVLFFDELSETELVQISWIWLLPCAFGLFGLAFRRSKRPILYALAAMAVGAVGLACSFGTLWSSP